MKIKLNNVRLAFPDLFKATTVNGEGDPAYSATFLIDPADPQVAAVNSAIEVVAKEKWGAKAADIIKRLRATDRVAIHDGNLKSQYAGYAGQLYVSARRAEKDGRPTVLDADKTPLQASDGRPYSGCYVNAVIDLWAMDNKFGQRVSATLMGVQFAKDGDAFSGAGVASDDDFDSVELAEDFV